jgi:hypothetical protein
MGTDWVIWEASQGVLVDERLKVFNARQLLTDRKHPLHGNRFLDEIHYNGAVSCL